MKLSKGKQSKAELIWIYGVDGIGKSSFCADAPDPFVIDTEDRTGHLNVDRAVVHSLEEFYEALEYFKKSKKLTLVIDSLDWLEPMLIAVVLKKSGKKKIQEKNDYGEGFTLLLDEYRNLIQALMPLRGERNIIFTGHSEVKTINDPQTGPFDRHQPKLYNKASALFREFVDCVLFANTEVLVKEKERRGFSDNVRWLFTERRPAYDAKNSFDLPEKFELKQQNPFKYYIELKGVGAKPEDIRKTIEAWLPKLNDEDRKLVESKMVGADVDGLKRIKNKIEEMFK